MTTRIPRTSQFHFFVMPDETRRIVEFLSEQQCAIYPGRLSGNEPKESGIPAEVTQVFFCPRELASEIKTYRIKDELFTIDLTTSPVIEFDPSYLTPNGLSRGRLFFHGGYDGREKWVAYPECLHETYKKVISFMKRSFLTNDRAYLGYVSKGSHKYATEGGQLKQF